MATQVYEWADRPIPSRIGEVALMSDVGPTGSHWYFIDGDWVPFGGECLADSLDTTSSDIGNTETVVFGSTAIPTGVLSPGMLVILPFTITKSGTTDAGNLRIYIGTTGTTADTLVVDRAALIGAGQRQYSGFATMRIETETTVQVLPNSIGLGDGSTNTAIAGVVTIPDVSTDGLYITVTLQSAGASDTVALMSARLLLDMDTPIQSLTIDLPDPLDIDRVYSINQTTAIPVSGQVILGGDSVIQGRLVDAVDGVTLASGWDWQDIATSSGLVWSVANLRSIATIPTGDWILQVRKSGEPALSAASWGSRLGVGYVVLCLGQSPMQFWWSANAIVSPYANTFMSVSGGRVPVGQQTKSRRSASYGFFGSTRNNLVTNSVNIATGEPIFVTGLMGGFGGNGLTAFLEYCRQNVGDGSIFCGSAHALGGRTYASFLPGGDSYEQMASRINGEGGVRWSEIDAVFHAGGEAEAAAAEETTFDEMVEIIRGVRDNLRVQTGNPDLPYFTCALGPTVAGDSTDERNWAIRQAQLYVCDNDANTYLLYNPLDRPLGPGESQHIEKHGYGEYTAPRSARNYLNYLYVESSGARGLSYGALGPEITGGSAAVGTNTVVLTVTQHGGTTLQDSSGNPAGTGLTQFAPMQVGGTTRNITAAYLDTGTIVLEFDGAALLPGDEIYPLHQWGRTPDTTNCVFDDSALTVPLQPSRYWFKVTAA